MDFQNENTVLAVALLILLAIGVGLIHISVMGYKIGWRYIDEGVSRWLWERAMKRKLKRDVLRKLEDAIVDVVENLHYKGNITTRERRWCYWYLGRALRNKNFLPTNLTPHPQELKNRIISRRKIPVVPVPLPDGEQVKDKSKRKPRNALDAIYLGLSTPKSKQAA